MKNILSALVLSIAAGASAAWANTPGEVPVGGTLREAQMQGLSGSSGRLSVYLGKPLIINVWASWCGPCRLEMASLERLSRRFSGKHFNVIGISTDDYREPAQAFLRQSGTTFPNFIDSKVFLENMLGADRIPLTLLVDAKGHVLAKYYGTRQWDSPESVEMIAKAFRLKL